MNDPTDAPIDSSDDLKAVSERSFPFENDSLAMLIVDVNTAAIYKSNAAATRLLELPVEDSAAVLSAALSPSHESIVDVLREAARTGHLEFRDYHAPSSSGERTIELQGGIINRVGEDLLLVVAHDLSGFQDDSSSHGTSATLDDLTRVPNEAIFRDRLQQALARAQRANEQFAVLYLDIDCFKSVNDRHGRAGGDILLQGFAERLRGFVRATDTVARFDGDAFVLLVTGLQDAAHSAILAQKILRSLATPFSIDGSEIRVSVSIGVSLYHRDMRTPDDYIERALHALKSAKAEGRNTYRFHTETLDELFRQEVAIGTDLHHALDDEALTLHYQPQIDLSTNRVVGLEALARWNHPRRGSVAPSAFIPVAERTNLIGPLGTWVLHEACRQARIWADSGLLPDVMAINLSPLQFKEQDLVAEVRRALGESGVPPDRIELEITESVVMESMGGYHATLSRLRSDGVRFSIDDFGTGYSSLKYLRTFPVQKLKIAQEFVSGVPDDRNDTAIVRATIDLAKDMEMTVIAEGAETAAQVEFLRALRCDQVQGYYFSQPLDAEAATRFLQARR